MPTPTPMTSAEAHRLSGIARRVATPPRISGGKWATKEHCLFLQGLEVHGKGQWLRIATLVKSRTNIKVGNHTSKFFENTTKAWQKDDVD